MRSALVAALVSCADSPHRSQIRRFVQGLSADELQFIAGFLGACVLESSRQRPLPRAAWAAEIVRYQRDSSRCASCAIHDIDHKMILLLEFLCRSGDSARTPLSANN